MLRCHFCGKHAMAGLAHLHGLTVPLCRECSAKIVEKLALLDCSQCERRVKTEGKLHYVGQRTKRKSNESGLQAA